MQVPRHAARALLLAVMLAPVVATPADDLCRRAVEGVTFATPEAELRARWSERGLQDASTPAREGLAPTVAYVRRDPGLTAGGETYLARQLRADGEASLLAIHTVRLPPADPRFPTIPAPVERWPQAGKVARLVRELCAPPGPGTRCDVERPRGKVIVVEPPAGAPGPACRYRLRVEAQSRRRADGGAEMTGVIFEQLERLPATPRR